MTDSKPLRLTIALSALFIGLAIIFATVFPTLAHQLGWLPTTTMPMMNGAMMPGGHMNGGYMSGGMMNGLLGGFGFFGMFFWPLVIIGLIALGVVWYFRSKPAAQQ